jgi:hypothetical protein
MVRGVGDKTVVPDVETVKSAATTLQYCAHDGWDRLSGIPIYLQATYAKSNSACSTAWRTTFRSQTLVQRLPLSGEQSRGNSTTRGSSNPFRALSFHQREQDGDPFLQSPNIGGDEQTDYLFETMSGPDGGADV